MRNMTIALAGNPNVGKSTLFNALTGLRQHTGNWAGKTVETACGTFRTRQHICTMIDLPGTYSLNVHSEEERVAKEFLTSGAADVIVIVCDATSLQRSLHLVLQCLSLSEKIILCVNLMDEAAKHGVHPDLQRLSAELEIPVIGCTARRKRSLIPLLEAIDTFTPNPEAKLPSMSSAEIAQKSQAICRMVISHPPDIRDQKMGKADRILTGSISGFVLMLLTLALILWMTIAGANKMSDFLFALMQPVTAVLDQCLKNAPVWLHGIMIDGMWRVLSWVVAVMLPPMAIFFPLFTIMEDAGFLPRFAFALDRPLRACDACGKQALTCCMGLGCNAAGVVGCRIIDSPRERLLAILTNCLTPCSGRFPILAAMSAMMFSESGHAWKSAVAMTGLYLLSLAFTFSATKLLSSTVLRGAPCSFAMELPPFRMPQIGRVLLRSVLDRTIIVLGRAVLVAAPAGMLIWIFANVSVRETTLLLFAADGLQPLGLIMGLDGVILLSFFLGLPANEIVLPLIMMGYLSSAMLPDLTAIADMRTVLSAHCWTFETMLCVSIFTLAHWPCSTTIITIYKETHSVKYTLLSVLLPTAIGAGACISVHSIFTLLHH